MIQTKSLNIAKIMRHDKINTMDQHAINKTKIMNTNVNQN